MPINVDIAGIDLTLITAFMELKNTYEANAQGFVLELACGYRSSEAQLRLFCQGRLPECPGAIVTWKDGFINKSKHNCKPSKAIDIWIKKNNMYIWDPQYFMPFGQWVQTNRKGVLRWGGEFKDWPHIELL